MNEKDIVRCVNLDWLECHCLEPDEPRDVKYFASRGFIVTPRDYGTRIYNEMFTVCDQRGNPCIEVRRSPKSPIHSEWECHLRLVNAYCYVDGAAQLMQDFIDQHGFIFNRISRVDVCLDFPRFDYGDDPAKFIDRYLRGRYSKINQANIHAHGTDRWNGRDWNSLSWGSPSSDIGTKMYNKTLELYDPITKKFGKPHIRFAWLQAGLIDDWNNCTLKGELQQIWRVEFSIRSGKKKWFKIELNGQHKNYQSIHNTLDVYDTRPKMLTIFASLANHYFHFKRFVPNQRKDRCPDKPLFNWTGHQLFYKLGKDAPKATSKIDKPLETLINKIRLYRETHSQKTIIDACNVLIQAMQEETFKAETNLFTHEEIQALRLAMSIQSRKRQPDAAVLLREIKELLKINDNTIIF